jgi:hypothetical protein
LAAAAATSPAALAHNLPGSGTVTGEPNNLQEMPCDPLPAAAQEAVNTVGQPICSVKSKSLFWGMYVGIGCCVLGLPALIYGIIQLVLQSGPMGGRIAPLVLGIIFLLLGIGCFVAAYLEPQRVLWLCPGGLIWQVRGRTGHDRWHEISRLNVLIALVITTGAINSRRLVYRYKLETASGFRMQLHSDELFGTRTVGEYIQEQSTRVLLPMYAQQLQQGNIVDFGIIRMDRQTLTCQQVRVPWAQVIRIGVSQGNILVDLAVQPGRLSVSLESVPHVLAFLNLAGQMTGAGR